MQLSGAPILQYKASRVSAKHELLIKATPDDCLLFGNRPYGKRINGRVVLLHSTLLSCAFRGVESKACGVPS